MTLLDYELHLRTDRVLKGRNIFLKGQVLDLHKTKLKWAATAKIGLYKMRIEIRDINILTCTCKCDCRYTSFCEHIIAMLYALRKELDLKPIVASFVSRLPPGDNRLDLMVRSFKKDNSLTSAAIASFTETAQQVLLEMKNAFDRKDFELAAGKAIQVCAAVQKMDKLMAFNYIEAKPCTAIALELLEKLFTLPVKEELQAMLFHDVRIEAVRNYNHVIHRRKNWFDILLAGANAPDRKDQFIRTMKALRVLVESYENLYVKDIYIDHLEDYIEKIV